MIILGFVLSLLFLILALKDANLEEIKSAFSEAKYWPIIPMLLSFLGFYWLKALRWSLLLSPSHKVNGNSLVPAMMAGAAGNNLLPAHFGEFVRVYFAGKKFNIPKSTVFATLVVERLFDVIIVLIIFSVALMAGEYSKSFYSSSVFLFFAAMTVMAGSVLLTMFTNQFVSFFEHKLTFLSVERRKKISEHLVNLSDGLLALRERNLIISVAVNSLIQWLFMATCFYFSLVAFNLDVSPSVAIIILGFTVVGLTLPTSPGFFGTIEYCYVLALTSVGVDPSTAVSAAIFYHLPAWTAVTVTGLVLLRVYHFSLAESRAALSEVH